MIYLKLHAHNKIDLTLESIQKNSHIFPINTENNDQNDFHIRGHGNYLQKNIFNKVTEK